LPSHYEIKRLKRAAAQRDADGRMRFPELVYGAPKTRKTGFAQ
jgi:hypothetical protein